MSAAAWPDPAEAPPPPAARQVFRRVFRSGETTEGPRVLAEEVAVALSYDGSTHAVMMATPAELEDFAVGFSLTERIVEEPEEIESIAVLATTDGIDLQMRLRTGRAEAVAARRRHLAGPTGCGLCGIESLAEAMRSPPPVPRRMRIDASALGEAVASLSGLQALYRQTGAVHGAAFWRPAEGIVRLREDVGRHNALDKLAGALARDAISPAGGAVLLTSRLSVEMVQKAAVLGAEVLVAISAPTGLAVRTAEAAGITLVAIARADGFEVFTRPERLRAGPAARS
ncbi:formate dehydrogenase accessory sulfurtransferase FdhD [Propylenella binzhouense]|uniref:Sulfur carrier protein FdhD n=1 Tax=Propylenella binzhouense TaxID=2555902 RepID=A0A964WV27_9HYPH|nr:formate dehydrogenase accessory sulfurtransferase FdhD [Propylenella binzhouense]MYZ49608.1 formate dehydrogenase accessory sulfurtransferase FdhD [Propylenella binzhouense]